MSSNQGDWAVVVNSKIRRLKENIPAQNEHKSENSKRHLLTGQVNTPKIADILPGHQIKSLYKMDNKEQKIENAERLRQSINNNKPSLKVSSIKGRPTIRQKQKPRTLEAGFSSLDIVELETLLESRKISFTDNHLLWLKEISNYINENVNIEMDPVFSGKSINYPSDCVPSRLKALIYKYLTDAGVVVIQYFFDHILYCMAVDLSKGMTCVGYKTMLQLIAHEWPMVCVNSLAKVVLLRNSYQNRSQIGLSILWAVGQGGVKDLTVGLKVWQNVMVAVLDTRSYSKYVCEYIYQILHLTEAVDVNISRLVQEEFFVILNELSKQQEIQKDCQKLLHDSAAVLVIKYVQSAPKVTNVFFQILKRLKTTPTSILLTPALAECLAKDIDCLKVWKMNYKKLFCESFTFLAYLENNWTNLSCLPLLKESNIFKLFLCDINKLNETILANNKFDIYAANEAIELVKALAQFGREPARKK